MSQNIIDNLSLLASQAPLRQKAGNNSVLQDTGFAGRLERALAEEPSLSTSTKKAEAIAESLSLQMLQKSLSLAGDVPAESSEAHSTLSVNSLLMAYKANLAATGESPSAIKEPIPHSPAPSQIQELAYTPESGPPRAEKRSTDHESWLDPIIAKASSRYGIDVGLIKAVIKAESGFNPQAVSHAGASGLMQLMPATAHSLGVKDPFDPEQNVMAGTRFLSEMLQRYNGNIDSALAAYNWGPGNVDRRPDRLPRETRDYLVRVKQLYNSYTG
ncbi:MAG: lytic transglycosylase domain-containing protein [Deltaproteobacteria bacterium]|nr:lytic transglycosylase domain-containing protein [Deltaproteobacteria bacterium]